MVDKTDETFVYEGKEWNLTGRKAQKNIFSKRKPDKTIGMMTILEIRPVDSNDPMFCKWVDPRDLYYIREDTNIDIEEVREQNEGVANEQDD